MPAHDTYAIVVIGDEILNATVPEGNSITIITALTEIGYESTEIRIVRDDARVIASAIKELCAANTYLFTTGGIGPTHDDMTITAFGTAFESPIVEHTHMRTYLTKNFRSMHPAVRQQLAQLPEMAKIYDNTPYWPIISVENCFILPGIPKIVSRAMHRIQEIIPFQPRFYHAEFFLRVHELNIFQWLDEYQRINNTLIFGCYPRTGASAWRSRITVRGRDYEAFNIVVKEMTDHFKKKRWLIKHRNKK